MKSSKAISNKSLFEEKIESLEIYKGKSYSFFVDTVKLPDGTIIEKDYIKYPEAVAIIPFLDADTIVLVKQYRYPIGKETYEIPAGKMDRSGETNQEAALRELLEETGYRANKIEYLQSFYPSPGYSTERIYVFKALDLNKESQDLDEDEFIEIKLVPFKEAIDMIYSGLIIDSKTILSLLYLHNK